MEEKVISISSWKIILIQVIVKYYKMLGKMVYYFKTGTGRQYTPPL